MTCRPNSSTTRASVPAVETDRLQTQGLIPSSLHDTRQLAAYDEALQKGHGGLPRERLNLEAAWKLRKADLFNSAPRRLLHNALFLKAIGSSQRGWIKNQYTERLTIYFKEGFQALYLALELQRHITANIPQS